MQPELSHQPKVVSPAPPLDFNAVYREYGTFVWRSLRRLGVPEADVPDATQEAFVVIHRRLTSFEHRSSLKTWLFGISMRVAADWRKKLKRRRETVLDDAPERTTSGETAVRTIALKQARVRFDEALDLLDEDRRAVFILFDMEQQPMNEVAETLGVPLQTAYTRLYAARKTLDAWVQQEHARQEAAAAGGAR